MGVKMLSLGLLLLSCFATTLIEGCGKRPAGARVVAGTDAVPHSWPWQISLQRKNPRYNAWFHTCGGSLITPEYVVTAAHCVATELKPGKYRVVVGEHDRRKDDGQQNIGVHSIHSHEGFSMRHLKNDIALIRLVKPVALDSRVGTVCLPPKNSRVAAGTKCFITGWGRTIGGGKAATILQQAEMPVSSHEDCVKANNGIAQVHEESMLCAGYATTGVHISGCQGDSGGPFVCEEGNGWVLRGAVGWGNPKCKAESTYTVFARVSTYIDWINQRINSGGTLPPPPPPTKPPQCKNQWGDAKCEIYKANCNFITVKLGCKKTCNFCRRPG